MGGLYSGIRATPERLSISKMETRGESSTYKRKIRAIPAKKEIPAMMNSRHRLVRAMHIIYRGLSFSYADPRRAGVFLPARDAHPSPLDSLYTSPPGAKGAWRHIRAICDKYICL